MRVSDWMVNQPNLFDELHKLDPSLSFIEDFTPEAVEMLYMVQHSDRKVSDKMMGKTTTDLAQMVNVLFGQSWSKALNEFNEQYEIGTDVTRELEDETHSESGNEHTSDVVGKTSPFNSQDRFVDTSGTEDRSKNDSVGTTTRTSRDSTKTLDAVHSYRALFQDLILTDVVFFDINNLLTLQIY